MHTMQLALAILLLLAVLAAFAWQGTPRRRNNETVLSNLFEGVHDSIKTLIAASNITTRYLLAKAGADDNHADICGAADVPIGFFQDEGSAEDPLGLAVGLLGHGATKRAVSSEIIAFGEEVFTAANGKVQNRPTGAGTYWFIGIALSTSTGDGDVIELNDCVPVKLVISGGA